MKLLILACSFLTTSAFVQPSGFKTFHRPLHVSSSVEQDVPIIVTGNNIDLTEALIDYVNRKLEKPLGKLRANGSIQECEVHLSVNKNPKVKDAHRVEVTTSVKGTTFRSTEESPDMYASVDAVADRLARKLRKYKERRLQGYHGGDNMGKDTSNVLENMEELDELGQLEDDFKSLAVNIEDMEDPYAPKVTKIKSFDLEKPVSLQEAIFALDYLDHDFYVFREEETNEISVVYKRNAGGIGLIQPQ